MIGYYEYKVEYYDETLHKMTIQTGVVCGDKHSDAVNALESFYGEECINNILWLQWVQEGAVLELGNRANNHCDVDETMFDYSSIKTRS